MKRFIAAVIAATFSTVVYAAPPEVGDWREANKRVEQAGGWKAYAREIEADQAGLPQADGLRNDGVHRHREPEGRGGPLAIQASLSLEAAVQRALLLDTNLQQALSNTSRDPKQYLALSEHQRSALTREAQLIAEVQALYYAAVAAQERVNYQLQVAEAASIASELATRMRKVGNLNLLHQAEEQLSFAETEKNLSHARVAASAAREALVRRLQLGGTLAVFSLPNRLPELPATASTVSNTDTTLMEAATTNPAMVRAQSEARQAILARNEAFALAKHYRDEILPLQKQISEEHLLHYNGMIIGIFELLKDAKHQVHAVEGYLTALNNYWQAQAALAPKLFALREQFSQFRRDAWK
jgi:outer membrane protein TolC